MGQRPSFSHLTGYPEAVASAQDFAPYGHTDLFWRVRVTGTFRVACKTLVGDPSTWE